MSAKQVLPLFAVVLGMLSVGTAPAAAQAAGPAWAISSIALPTNFSQADSEGCNEVRCDAYFVVVTNVGSQSSVGPLTITDRLPQGVVVEQIMHSHCSGANGGSTVTCSDGALAPGASFETFIFVKLTSDTSRSVVNVAIPQRRGR